MTQTTAPSRHSNWFVLVAALFVTCLVVSNIIAVKVIDVAGYILPAAIIIFPVSYILGDILTEVYGYGRARQVIWLGFLCNVVAVVAIAAGGLLPAAGFWGEQEAYDAILGATPRILAASFIAYLIGELVNAWVLARLKVAMEGRHLWVRTIGSTLVGQILDSAVFITIAFAGIMPVEIMVGAVITQWLVKSAYEALATPLTYAAVGFLKRADDVDVYDRDLHFRPFTISE